MQAALQSWYLWLIVTRDEMCQDKLADQKAKSVSNAKWKAEKK
jgi:hypothetical protein